MLIWIRHFIWNHYVLKIEIRENFNLDVWVYPIPLWVQPPTISVRSESEQDLWKEPQKIIGNCIKRAVSLFFLSFTAKKVTFIGATAGDEMCNLYMMYFFPPGKAADYLGCAGVQAGNEITEGKFICFDGKFKKIPHLPFPSISFSFRFLSHLRNVSRWNW